MRKTAPLSVALVTVVVVIAVPAAGAKLPPGTIFEACGESGCETTSAAEAKQLELRLIAPTIEHGDAGAPSGTREFIRADVRFDAARLDALGAGARDGLLQLEKRRFPVIFVPSARVIGVPRASGSYRWVKLRTRDLETYAQLAEGVRPFPERELVGLDTTAIARATPADLVGVDEKASGTVPGWLAALGALVALALSGIAMRGWRVRQDPASGTPA